MGNFEGEKGPPDIVLGRTGPGLCPAVDILPATQRGTEPDYGADYQMWVHVRVRANLCTKFKITRFTRKVVRKSWRGSKLPEFTRVSRDLTLSIWMSFVNIGRRNSREKFKKVAL